MRIRQCVLVLVLLVAAWSSASYAGVSDLETVQTLLFRALGNEPNNLSMTATRVVPPSGSTATGTAALSYLAPNLSYNITHNVPGETSAAIHGPGYGYENGPVIFSLPLGSPKIGSVMLNPAQQDLLLEGKLYIQINSAAFPGGDIRTQIYAVNPPMQGAPVWIRVQVKNLGPDPYDGVDLFRLPGLSAPPPARGTKLTVDIDEPSKPWQLDRPAAVFSKDFQADIPVGVTIEFDLGYFGYFPSFPTAHTEALAEVDSLNTDPNPANNSVQNDFAVLRLAHVPAVGAAGLAALGMAIAAFGVWAARRRRVMNTTEEDA